MAVQPGNLPHTNSRRDLRAARGGPASSAREGWADSAKGMCILLVILGHAVGMYGVLGADIPGWVQMAWNTVIMAFKPIRVPLFFLISGYFAHRAIQRPWRSTFRTRVGQNAYLYVLWVALLGLFFNAVIRPDFGGVDYSWQGVWAQLLNPVSHPWYLYALAVYFVIAKLMSRKHWMWVATGTAAMLYLASGQPWLPLPANLCSGLTFFLVGAYWPAVVRRSASQIRGKALAAMLCAYLISALIVRLLGISEVSAAMLVLSIIAVPTSVAIFSRVNQSGLVTGGLQWIGQRTLPVYVMHFPLLVMVSWLTERMPFDRVPAGPANFFYLLLPVLATLVAAGAAVGIHSCITRLPVGRWLFQLPAGNNQRERSAKQ